MVFSLCPGLQQPSGLATQPQELETKVTDMMDLSRKAPEKWAFLNKKARWHGFRSFLEGFCIVFFGACM